MKLSTATPEQLDAIEKAIAPFLEWIDVNDGDTLAGCRSDEEVITVATGSWSKPAKVTLGDFRMLRTSMSDIGKAHGEPGSIESAQVSWGE